MDTQKRTLAITGLVILLILSIIFITIFYLIRTVSNRTQSTNQRAQATPTPQATAFPAINIPPTSVASPSATPSQQTQTPTPTTQRSQGGTTSRPQPSPSPSPSPVSQPVQNLNSTTKVYNSSNFKIEYPSTWSILTCNNSQHFEFNPDGGEDMLNVSCSVAQKGITFLVNKGTGCRGNTITLGDYQVVKQTQQITNGVNYKWCVRSTPSLEVSHRVLNSGGTARSTKDFSKEVEQVIASLTIN